MQQCIFFWAEMEHYTPTEILVKQYFLNDIELALTRLVDYMIGLKTVPQIICASRQLLLETRGKCCNEEYSAVR